MPTHWLPLTSVLTEVNARNEHALIWLSRVDTDYDCIGRTVGYSFLSRLNVTATIRKSRKEDPMFMERIKKIIFIVERSKRSY